MALIPFRTPSARGTVAMLLLTLLVACSGDDGVTTQSLLDPNDLRLVDGPAACDSCITASVRITGAGVAEVVGAEVVTRGTPRQTVSASSTVRTLGSAPATVIGVDIVFAGPPASGTYDLLLHTDRSGADSVLVVPSALVASASSRGSAVRVWVRASGADIDDSLRVVIDSGCTDGCAPLAVGPYEGRDLPLSPGIYVLRLDGVATNCQVTNQNPARITVARYSPAAVTFTIACVTYPDPAFARVSVAVTGEDLDQSFSVNCGRADCTGLVLSPTAPRLVRFLPGTVPFLLSDVTSNCTVDGTNPRLVTAGPGQTVDVAFRLTCTKRPTITAIVQTSGTSLDEDYSLERCYSDGTGLQRCSSESLAGNDTTTFVREDGGTYVLSLRGVARNCTVGGGTARRIDPGTTSAVVTFPVTCVRGTLVRVTLALAGAGPDTRAWIVNERSCVSDGYYGTYCDEGWLANGLQATFSVSPGPQSFRLLNLPAFCTLSSANPLTFDAVDGATIEIRIEGTCPQATQVEVRVTAFGASVDGSFEVIDERSCIGDPYYGTSCFGQLVQSGESVRFTVTAGPQSFRLVDVAPNCALRSPNPATFDSPPGVTTAVAFNVECS